MMAVLKPYYLNLFRVSLSSVYIFNLMVRVSIGSSGHSVVKGDTYTLPRHPVSLPFYKTRFAQNHIRGADLPIDFFATIKN